MDPIERLSYVQTPPRSDRRRFANKVYQIGVETFSLFEDRSVRLESLRRIQAMVPSKKIDEVINLYSGDDVSLEIVLQVMKNQPRQTTPQLGRLLRWIQDNADFKSKSVQDEYIKLLLELIKTNFPNRILIQVAFAIALKKSALPHPLPVEMVSYAKRYLGKHSMYTEIYNQSRSNPELIKQKIDRLDTKAFLKWSLKYISSDSNPSVVTHFLERVPELYHLETNNFHKLLEAPSLHSLVPKLLLLTAANRPFDLVNYRPDQQTPLNDLFRVYRSTHPFLSDKEEFLVLSRLLSVNNSRYQLTTKNEKLAIKRLKELGPQNPKVFFRIVDQENSSDRKVSSQNDIILL